MNQLGVSFVSFIHLFLDTCLKNNNKCELCVNFFHDGFLNGQRYFNYICN